jgi:hypothetical protein
LKKILFPFLGERFGTYLLYRNGEVEKGPEYVLRYSTRRAVIQDFDTGEVMASGECLKPSNPKAVPESPRVLRESTNAVDRIAEMVTEEVLKRFGPAPSAPPVPPAIHLPTKEEKLVMIREAAERRKQNQRLSRLEQMEQGDYSDLGDDKLDFETYTNDEWEQ